MRRIVYLITLAMVAMLIFVPAALAQDEVTVTMGDNFFKPANITVEPGTTVTWVQEGENPHTTTSYDDLWDSGMIEGGSDGTFSYTFDEPGTYEYYCIPHESLGMKGTVTVSGASSSSSSTASSTATASAMSTASSMSASAAPLADTGGPAVMPVLMAALIVGCGILGLAVLRQGRAS